MRKFLIHTLLFFLPLILLMAYALPFVMQAESMGDLARMSGTRFRYEQQPPDTIHARAVCTDIALGEHLPDSLKGDFILILGDSFSNSNPIWPYNSRWHQYMGGFLGHRVVSVSKAGINPFQLFLTMLKYRPTELPDTVIIETVERAFVPRIIHLDFDSTPTPNVFKSHRIPKASVHERLLTYYKAKLNIDRPVLTLQLDTNLFSCRPNKLYALKEDTIQYPFQDASLIRNNFLHFVNLATEYGITIFVLLIPDKYTVYHHRCVENQFAQSYRLMEDSSIVNVSERLLNPLPLLRNLVDQGEQDVYLPDDSHFSSLAAKEIGLFVASKLQPMRTQQ